MRIAHGTATFPPYKGGTGNVCYHNARELVRLGHAVHVFTAALPDAPTYEVMEGIEVHRLRPLLRHGNAFFLPTIFTHLRNFDLVHLHMPFYGGAEAILLHKWVHKTPLVITHHQDVSLPGAAGIVSRLHDQVVGRWLMQIADRACFTSLDYGRSSQFGPLIKAGRLTPYVVPNGIDTGRFSPGERPSQLTTQYKTDARQVILFVGALDRAHYFKGVHVLLHAMKQVVTEDVLLIVVGKGDMLPEYQQMANELGITNKIIFAGFVPDEALADYYRLADVTVLPSTTMGEAFGLVLLESMACGTPVIASDIPGVRTVVDHGRDGFLVEAGNRDALAAQLQRFFALDRTGQRVMGTIGREKVVQTYRWQQIGGQLEIIYRQALTERQNIVHQQGQEVM